MLTAAQSAQTGIFSSYCQNGTFRSNTSAFQPITLVGQGRGVSDVRQAALLPFRNKPSNCDTMALPLSADPRKVYSATGTLGWVPLQLTGLAGVILEFDTDHREDVTA